MDEILHADDAELAQGALHQVVGGDGGAVASDLDKPTLVDQLAHRLEVGSSPGDVGFTDPEHVDGGLVQLGGHLVDTTNAHDKGQLGISRNIVVSLLASLTPQPDLIPLLILVLLGKLLSTLENVGTLGLASNLGLDSLLGPESPVLRLPLPPLQDRLRHCRQFAFHSHSGFSCRSESSNK